MQLVNKIFFFYIIFKFCERSALIQHANKFTDLFFVFSEHWLKDLQKQGISEDKIRVTSWCVR